MYSVFVAHPLELYRSLLTEFFNRQQTFKVIGETGDGQETVRLCKSLQPDLIYLDPQLPGINGLEVTHLIKENWPEARIIILSEKPDENLLFDAIRAGICGFLDTSISSGELLKSTHQVLKGEFTLSPELTPKAIEGIQRLCRQETQPKNKKSLTQRERELLTLLVKGYTNKEIANFLTVTPHTVKNHLYNIMDKLGIQNRVQLAAHAVQEGLVQWDLQVH
ncbi:MAG: response regulator transcription factor [Clostridia bacterium]|nr:response regulator transcription factor [Clostridia bacterium]